MLARISAWISVSSRFYTEKGEPPMDRINHVKIVAPSPKPSIAS